MKVKCKQIINEHTQQQQNTSTWLTIGKEYIVLAIEVYPAKNLYLLVDDSSDQAPGLHDAKQFEVLSHHIPSNWVVNPGDLEVMTVGPKVWQEPTFWEDCYDNHPATLALYKREARIIYEEEGAF
ncbi:hypothetical protein BH10PSE19_BH10PSE19_20610 [soil metagenome]